MPGTVNGPACQGIVLNAGAQVTASFKLVTLVVNSTLDTDDPTQAALGICDVTPGQPHQTCTLRQAIEVANQLGGGSITFDIAGGGTPTITVQSFLPPVVAPMTIDASTQPGSALVALHPNGAVASGIGIGAPDVTFRGFKVYGFTASDVSLGVGAASDLIEGNQIDTVPGEPSTDTASVDEFHAVGHNTIRGNAIGYTTLETFKPVINLSAPGDTLGGASPGQGNTVNGGVIDGPSLVLGDGSVVQGNQIHDSVLVVGNGSTVGGATPNPGTGAGNDIASSRILAPGFKSSGVKAGSTDVVQGNRVSGADVGIVVYGAHDTIGGASPQLGNQILGNQTGIGIGLARQGLSPTPSDGNVVENNAIFGNDLGDGGVTVYDGIGNHIFENEIDNNHAANINLGGGPYRYDTLGGSGSGPNHDQPYPNLLDAASAPTVTITAQLFGGLAHAHDPYTIDLYAQATGCQESVSEGQAYEWLGSARVHADGIGTASFRLTVPRSRAQHLHGPTFVSDPAFTMTATSADGSTSELSPCLTLGHHAPSFARSGVGPTSKTIAVTPSPLAVGDIRGLGETPRSKKPERLVATLRLLCPPVTARYCAGSFRFVTFGRHGMLIARRHFKLVPGQVLAVKLPVSKRLLATLKRAHRVHTLLTVIARDGKRHPDRKKTKAKITLILKP